MKAGARALGVAFSDGPERSTCCGAVVRADRAVDGVALASCTVGGRDATRAVVTVFEELDREDVQYVLIAGVAPAWFNLVDLHEVHEAVERPTLAVSFEASPGLEPALREAFSGDELRARLAVYRSLPERRAVDVDGGAPEGSPDAGGAGDGETLFVRAVGVDGEEAAGVVRGFTPAGGRPEPVRVARLVARGGRSYVERERDDR